MAEKNYLKKKEQGDTLNESLLAIEQRSSTSDQSKERSQASVSVSTTQSINIEVINTLEQVLQQLLIIEPQKQLHVLKELFSNYASKFNVSVPGDFIDHSIKGMKNLKDARRSNIIYAMARGFGTQRHSGDDTLFPTMQTSCVLAGGVLCQLLQCQSSWWGENVLTCMYRLQSGNCGQLTCLPGFNHFVCIRFPDILSCRLQAVVTDDVFVIWSQMAEPPLWAYVESGRRWARTAFDPQ